MGASIFRADGSIPSAFVRAAVVKDNIALLTKVYEAACLLPGFDPNALDTFRPLQDGAIHSAALGAAVLSTRFLLERGADPNLRSRKRHETPLMSSLQLVDNDALETAQLLVEWRADVNARDKNGQTALFTTVLVGSLEGLEFLLANGADPNIPDDDGIRPIDVAQYICRFQQSLINARVERFRVCVRPVDRWNHCFEYHFPGDQIAVRDRLAGLLNEPEPREMGFSDIDFARKYRLESIHELLTRNDS